MENGRLDDVPMETFVLKEEDNSHVELSERDSEIIKKAMRSNVIPENLKSAAMKYAKGNEDAKDL